MKLVNGITLFLIFILCSSCLPFSENKKKLKIALNEWPAYAPIAYAKQLGLYKKYNLDVEPIFISNPNEMNEKFKTQQLDAVATVLIDVVATKAGGRTGKIVLLTDYSIDGDVIVANKKINSVKDLKGKTVGVNYLNSFSHIFMLEALKMNGLTERDVNWKIVPFENVPNTLSAGEIAAGHTWEPAKSKSLEHGDKIIFRAGDIKGLISEGIVFQEEVINQHPQLVKKFIDIFYIAQEEMLRDKKKSAYELQKFYKNDPEIFLKSFDDVYFITKNDNRKLMNGSDQLIYKQLKLINDFFYTRGQASSNEIYKDILAENLYK